MAYYPQDATGLNYITYPVGPTAAELSVTASASANTKGSYVQVVASLGFTCNAAAITTTFGQAASSQWLLDIATGAGGAEVVKVPDLISDSCNTGTSHTPGSYFIPLGVTSGTRIAARCAVNTTGSPSLQTSFTLSAAGGVSGITSFTNIGSNSSDSGGVQIDPGGSASTKGSYSQISASTGVVAQFLLLMGTCQGNTANSSDRWLLDIATGAAASEVVLIPDVRMSVGTNLNEINPRSVPFLTYIASSTRVAVRASCSVTDATDRLIDVAMLIAPAPTESGGGGGAWAYA